MIGYRIAERGIGLLNAYVSGAELIWIPGVNYARLEKMALVLNKMMFGAREGYFSVDFPFAEEDELLALSALEMDGYIERSIIPEAGGIASRYEKLLDHSGIIHTSEED